MKNNKSIWNKDHRFPFRDEVDTENNNTENGNVSDEDQRSLFKNSEIKDIKDCNTGNTNTGYMNNVFHNTGDRNIGYYNTGDCNTGNKNTGDMNTGDCNTGGKNTGDKNTGGCNTGNMNTGYMNPGYCNTGDKNTGDCNTGDCNTGNKNTGSKNTGDMNTGDCNTGNCNTGDWTRSSFNTGCFNTVEQKIMLFNKPSGMTYSEWMNSDARWLLNKIPKDVVKWIDSADMTDEEKEQHLEYKTTDGYLKVLDEAESRQNWWNNLSDSDKDIIKSIPNFDSDIFEECTGIKVDYDCPDNKDSNAGSLKGISAF